MAQLLRFVGGGWALMGLINIVLMFPDAGGNTITFGLIFNMLLFIMPGLVVYAAGDGMAKRQQKDED